MTLIVESWTDDELYKDLCAHFGLAYYNSDVLHRGLCNLLTGAEFKNAADITQPRIEEVMVEAFSLTLGQLRVRLESILPLELLPQLDACIEKRNFLAHHFWFERAHLMVDRPGVLRMIDELNSYSRAFSELDREIERLCTKQYQRLGITSKMLEGALEETLSGKPFDPLPVQRKLKKQERIVRVWEFTSIDGIQPLIFETVDGNLWQLSDVGLGWTYYREIGPDWRENELIKPYLPATVNPRPASDEPWTYEFRLKGNAVLWVRKSPKLKAFSWGVRTGRHGTSGLIRPS